MGSRASILLQDSEIEEIQKETGCEFLFYGGMFMHDIDMGKTVYFYVSITCVM